jgi:hypothetical protein
MFGGASDGLTSVGVMHCRMQPRGPYCEVWRMLWGVMIALLWNCVLLGI